MAEGLKCPAMRWGTGDDQSALMEFKRRIQRWFDIKGTAKEAQHDYIIFQAGERGEELSRTWTLTSEELKIPKNVWDKLEQSVGIADNFRVHRLNLNSYRQKETESIDEFYTRCRALAMKCKFDVSLDDRLIDQLITGTWLLESRRELLKTETLSLDDALRICRTHEATEVHMKAYGLEQAKIDTIKKKSRQVEIKDCDYCGTDHVAGNCPAYYAECLLCGKTGHFKRKCRNNMNNVQKPEMHKFNKNRYSQAKRGKSIHMVSYDEPEQMGDEIERLSFDSIEGGSNDEIFTTVQVQVPCANRVGDMSCKVDTGAQGNILPIGTFRKMCPTLCDKQGMPIYGNDVIKFKPLVRLGAYNGTEIKQHGAITISVKVKSSEWLQTEFFLVETDGPIILGGQVCIQLGIVSINTIDEVKMKEFPITNASTLKQMYQERFAGTGKYPGTCHFQLKDNARPTVDPPRKFPVHLQQDPKSLKWSKAQILQKTQEPRSYMVQTENGTVLRRNRRFLKDIPPRKFDVRQSMADTDTIIPHSEPYSMESDLDRGNQQSDNTCVDIPNTQTINTEMPISDRDDTGSKTIMNSRPRRSCRKPPRLIESM